MNAIIKNRFDHRISISRRLFLLICMENSWEQYISKYFNENKNIGINLNIGKLKHKHCCNKIDWKSSYLSRVLPTYHHQKYQCYYSTHLSAGKYNLTDNLQFSIDFSDILQFWNNIWKWRIGILTAATILPISRQQVTI